MTRFDHTRAKTLRARLLRRESTRPEMRLWLHLRGAQLDGYSFRRQHPVGPYTVDFYCSTAKLAIELDGDDHSTAAGLARDAVRTRFLNARGIRVIRFPNRDVGDNLDGVLQGIHRVLLQSRPSDVAR